MYIYILPFYHATDKAQTIFNSDIYLFNKCCFHEWQEVRFSEGNLRLSQRIFRHSCRKIRRESWERKVGKVTKRVTNFIFPGLDQWELAVEDLWWANGNTNQFELQTGQKPAWANGNTNQFETRRQAGTGIFWPAQPRLYPSHEPFSLWGRDAKLLAQVYLDIVFSNGTQSLMNGHIQ